MSDVGMSDDRCRVSGVRDSKLRMRKSETWHNGQMNVATCSILASLAYPQKKKQPLPTKPSI